MDFDRKTNNIFLISRCLKSYFRQEKKENDSHFVDLVLTSDLSQVRRDTGCLVPCGETRYDLRTWRERQGKEEG